MGLIDIIKKTTDTPIDPNKLTLQDLEYLINTLKTVTLRGDQVETFYNLVVKLQNQYIALSDKKQ